MDNIVKMGFKVPKNEKDLFAGNKDFFETLKSSMNSSDFESQDDFIGTGSNTNSKKLNSFQILLLVIMTAIAVPLIYITVIQGLIINSQKPQQGQFVTVPVNAINNINNNEELLNQIAAKEVPESKPVSLTMANQEFANKNYINALNYYEQINKALSRSNEKSLVGEFVELRIAFCLQQLGHMEQSHKLLRIVSTSNSPALAAIAYYHRALIEYDRQMYLQARNYAYRAMALCQAVNSQTDWALNLQRNCRLLIAFSLTRKTVSLTDIDNEIPQELWAINKLFDPCNDMDEFELTSFLKDGTDIFEKAVIGPKIQKISYDNDIEQFQVIAKLSTIEEVLAKFATNTNMKLKWDIGTNANELIKKSVTLYMNNTTVEEFVTVAAGCAGLKTEIKTDNDQVNLIISNPDQYTDLYEHIDILTQTALDRWDDFIIKYYNDPRLDAAHYSMGILYNIASKANDAITQFKLLSNKYGYSPLAKYALLQSSKIKTDLHDYIGASQDLKQLIEQHNQSEIAQQACLYLAESSYESNLYNEAAKNYLKVYNFDFSIESKAEAALGAAKSYYMNGNYVLAENWLNRFIRISQGKDSLQLQYAYMLMGKICLKAEKPEQAFNAFKMAISRHISTTDRKEIITALYLSDLNKLDPVQALEVTNELQEKALSSDESIKVLIVRSRIFRKINLPEKALTALKERIEYITDANLKAVAYIEMARVLEDLDQYKIAANYLTKALTLAEPPLNFEITLQLAQVNLVLGKNKDARDLCSNLLKQDITGNQYAKAIEIIALAYKNQQNYEKALSSFLETKEEKDNNIIIEQDKNTRAPIENKIPQES